MSEENPGRDEMKRRYRKHKVESDEYFNKLNKQKMQRLVLDNRLKGKCVIDPDATNPVTFSYADLRDFVNKLGETQLTQQVQIIPKHAGSTPKPIKLEPVIGAGTVEELLHVDGEATHKVHSSIDWQHHPEEVVLLTDGNGFGDDGDTSYTMKEVDGELCFVGNKTGKVRPIIERKPGEPSIKTSRTEPFQTPLYGPNFKLEELAAKLDELCQNNGDKSEITVVMAELYRRTHKLTPKDQMKKEMEEQDELIREAEEEGDETGL